MLLLYGKSAKLCLNYKTWHSRILKGYHVYSKIRNSKKKNIKQNRIDRKTLRQMKIVQLERQGTWYVNTFQVAQDFLFTQYFQWKKPLKS